MVIISSLGLVSGETMHPVDDNWKDVVMVQFLGHLKSQNKSRTSGFCLVESSCELEGWISVLVTPGLYDYRTKVQPACFEGCGFLGTGMIVQCFQQNVNKNRFQKV